jgi:carotenoid 1,2-hydratase
MGGGLQTAREQDPDSGALPRGRRRASGSGGAHGGALGPAGSPAADEGPCFGLPVQRGGYAWWYVDALSDDGRHGLTLIAFIGSVFSPYYAWSAWADPLDHCAVNVALYGAAGKRWAMTERRRSALQREDNVLSIGPSRLAWQHGALTVRFDEVTAPFPRRVRGTIRLYPSALTGAAFSLDTDGRHVWRPLAPRGKVEVELEDPACRWRGNGYFDMNSGSEPLERAFCGWDWSRAHLPGDTLIFYDVTRRVGAPLQLALRVGSNGAVAHTAPPPRVALPPTGWRMPRTARGAASDPPRVMRTLEDTPFYSRSMLVGHYGGEPAEIVHESLSLDRLRSPIVRAMLPFRMPRVLV